MITKKLINKKIKKNFQKHKHSLNANKYKSIYLL